MELYHKNNNNNNMLKKTDAKLEITTICSETIFFLAAGAARQIATPRSPLMLD